MTFKNIVFTNDVAKSLAEFFQKNSYSSIAVLVDENTHEFCYPIVKESIPKHILIKTVSGEQNKTIETCCSIWQELTKAAFDRKSLLINLGGGVIGDMGGFCARTYKRGIDFINIPTTLLAQVDANVGGKLGVDFNSFKNHIGLFSDPDLIIIDKIFLETLPQRELISGFAEVIKHHLIADGQGWDDLKKKSMNKLNFDNLVLHSVKIKQNIVDQDPREKGLRKVLNFGHTIGHAIESYLLNTERKILHGEGAAAGMICETFLAADKGLVNDKEKKEIIDYLANTYSKVPIETDDIDEIVRLTGQDKKNKCC
ncbi:MAG: 3-dehydroquinate synthase [Bacteroidota bacterium]